MVIKISKEHLRESSIPVIPALGGISKSTLSNFLRNEKASAAGCCPESTIVVHPGSRYIKIGKAKDAFPLIIPHCIAYLDTCSGESTTNRMMFPNQDTVQEITEEHFNSKHLEYYKHSKKKTPPPNLYTNIRSFNAQQQPHSIPLHNDSYGIEWYDLCTGYCTGTDALRVKERHVVKWPLVNGRLNERDYGSYRAVIGDMDRIWTRIITEQLKLSDFKKYSVVLVLDDAVEPWEVHAYCELTLQLMGFKQCAFLKTSQAATFGCGVSSALVVDFGAQKTSIGCVEDGYLVPGSSVTLPVGGDDLARLFHDMLAFNKLPVNVDLDKPLDYDFFLNEFVKLLTFDEQEIGSVTVDVYKRQPGENTLLYTVKLCDERLLVPLEILQPGMPLLSRYSSGRTASGRLKFGDYSHYCNNTQQQPNESQSTTSSTDQLNEDVELETLVTTDTADTYSLIDYLQLSLRSLKSPERIQKLLSNVLFAGGSFYPQSAHFKVSLKSVLHSMEYVQDYDPWHVVWKGGAVLAKLEGVGECWVESKEWLSRGSRVLAENLPFSF